MMEMQLIIKDDALRSASKERWMSKIPTIIEQAKLEASHTTRFSSVINDLESDDGK